MFIWLVCVSIIKRARGRERVRVEARENVCMECVSLHIFRSHRVSRTTQCGKRNCTYQIIEILNSNNNINYIYISTVQIANEMSERAPSQSSMAAENVSINQTVY